MQEDLLSLIRRRQVVAHFVLAYAFIWVLYPLIAINPRYGVPGLFAPALAAVIASALQGGRAEVRQFLARVKRWRIGLLCSGTLSPWGCRCSSLWGS